MPRGAQGLGVGFTHQAESGFMLLLSAASARAGECHSPEGEFRRHRLWYRRPTMPTRTRRTWRPSTVVTPRKCCSWQTRTGRPQIRPLSSRYAVRSVCGLFVSIYRRGRDTGGPADLHAACDGYGAFMMRVNVPCPCKSLYILESSKTHPISVHI